MMRDSPGRKGPMMLDGVPVRLYGGGVGSVHVREDVRVTADELVDDVAGHVVHRPRLGLVLLGDPGVEHHLKQQVAELLAEVVAVPGLDRLEGLVGLLEQVRRQRAVRLLAVPRAAGAQPVHHPDQVDQPRPGDVVRAVQDLDLEVAAGLPDELVGDQPEQAGVTVLAAEPDDGRGPVRRRRALRGPGSGRAQPGPAPGVVTLDRDGFHTGGRQCGHRRGVRRRATDQGGVPQRLPGMPGQLTRRDPRTGEEYDDPAGGHCGGCSPVFWAWFAACWNGVDNEPEVASILSPVQRP